MDAKPGGRKSGTFWSGTQKRTYAEDRTTFATQSSAIQLFQNGLEESELDGRFFALSPVPVKPAGFPAVADVDVDPHEVRDCCDSGVLDYLHREGSEFPRTAVAQSKGGMVERNGCQELPDPLYHR